MFCASLSNQQSMMCGWKGVFVTQGIHWSQLLLVMSWGSAWNWKLKRGRNIQLGFEPNWSPKESNTGPIVLIPGKKAAWAKWGEAGLKHSDKSVETEGPLRMEERPLKYDPHSLKNVGVNWSKQELSSRLRNCLMARKPPSRREWWTGNKVPQFSEERGHPKPTIFLGRKIEVKRPTWWYKGHVGHDVNERLVERCSEAAISTVWARKFSRPDEKVKVIITIKINTCKEILYRSIWRYWQEPIIEWIPANDEAILFRRRAAFLDKIHRGRKRPTSSAFPTDTDDDTHKPTHDFFSQLEIYSERIYPPLRKGG